MVDFIVSKSEDGKRLDRVLLSKYSTGRNTVFKALRNKDIKVNGIRTSENIVLSEGDNVIAYINICDTKSSNDIFTVKFCDEDMIVVSKRQGVSVIKDEHNEFTVIDAVRQQYGNDCLLCHRLDRNTGGLLIIARSEDVYNRVVLMLENKDIIKKYICLVYGKINPTKEYICSKAWHFKDSAKSQVYISDDKKKHYKEIITRYRLIEYNEKDNTSLLEVIIDTGRTHQIRAHMAHLGYPLVGDNKYGSNSVNRQFQYKYQALWATEIRFSNDLVIKDKPEFK